MGASREELRQQGIVRTRRLVEAARQLQAERAIESIRVVDIVERAGYSVGTFYNAFDSVDAMWGSFLKEDLKAEPDKPYEVIARYMRPELAAAVKEALS